LGFAGHYASVISADVKPTDIVTHDEDDGGLFTAAGIAAIANSKTLVAANVMRPQKLSFYGSHEASFVDTTIAPVSITLL
jgi:hypothetical protein